MDSEGMIDRLRQHITDRLGRAENREEVERWAADCPILRSPEGFTEIREVAPFEL